MIDAPILSIDINPILLERQNKLVVTRPVRQSEDNIHIVLSMMKNIEDLGYSFSKELFDLLRFQPAEYLTGLYELMVPVLRKMVGGQVKHMPFYKNFPHQMGSMSELEIYFNAFVHYWTIGKWKPDNQIEHRFPLFENQPQIRMISPGTIDDFEQIFRNMISAKGSLSTDDRIVLDWYIQKSDPDSFAFHLPEIIPSKETLSVVVSSVMKYHPGYQGVLTRYFKTATDVLRLAVSLSSGDVSLTTNSRFCSFKRKNRKFLLNLLNHCGNIEEDMLRHKGKWLRLGERLHPGEFMDRYPVVYESFRKIRNDEKIETFGGKVESAIKHGEVTKVLQLLKRRGGELARKLDFLLRAYPGYTNEIISSFADVSSEISPQVILQVMAHFKNRSQNQDYRSFFPKGNISKVQVVENTLQPLPDEICQTIVSICEQELSRQFSSKEPLGKVYICPALKDVVVPLAQRASSKSLKTYARGSRFQISENANTIRAFIHWKNPRIRVQEKDTEQDFSEVEVINDKEYLSLRIDIDLSVGLYDKGWNLIEQVSYTNIRSEQFSGLYHSGDIVDAPEGASEFIDMDLAVLRENQIRYAVFNVYSYTRQGFNIIPECFFGWMERENPESGEIYEPRTVKSKVDLTSETTICLPVLFDLEEMKSIWLDIGLRSNPKWVNNIHANSNNVALMARAIVDLNKPNLYDLFYLNARARGKLVDTPEEADLRFGLDETDDVTPFQVERILSDFL